MLLQNKERRGGNMEKHTNDLTLTQEIAGYCRISVDEELGRDNTSIENQKKSIEEFVKA